MSWSDTVIGAYGSSPAYNTTDYITELMPILCITIGMIICFAGYRFSRVLCFVSGLLYGWLTVYWLFKHQTNLTTTTIPIIVGILISTSIGVMFLLLHSLTISAFIAHGLATHILLIDNGTFINDTNAKLALHIVLFIVILYYAAKHQKSAIGIGCAMYGSQLVILGIDSYTNKGLTAIAYQWTVLRYAVNSQAAVPRCEWQCKTETFAWFTLFCLGSATQLLLRQLDITSKKKDRLVLGQDKQFVNTYNYDAYATQKQRLIPKIEGASVRASYNYYDLKKLPVELTGIYSILHTLMNQLAVQYGFQYDNVQNQLEHILFLYANSSSRSLNDAITKLHNKIFSNYREWCEYIDIEPQLCNSKADKTTTELKLAELSLWLLIWGEASSLRHTPELLCYLYHNCSIELRSLHDNKPAPRRNTNDFLNYVVTPLYDVLKNATGTVETKVHYDDINEYFWTRDCLNTYYAARTYDVNNSTNDTESNTSQYSQLPTIHSVLQRASKTYLERRSWLHPLRSFYRLVVFYAVAFHVLVCLALLTYKNISWWTNDSNRVLSSFVITLAGTSLFKEVLDVWSSYGIINERLMLVVGFIVRLTIKAMFFMYLMLFYIWSIERSDLYYQYYIIIAGIYVIPTVIHVLSNLFPSISTLSRSQKLPFIRQVLQFWYPMNTLYVGRSVHEREGLTYKYQLFWLSLLSLKLFLSYHFQVAPLIAPSVRILYIASEVPVIRRYQSIADTLVLFVLWVPFILVYMFDTGIWYSVWQAGAGVVVGMMDRIGEIRSFTALVSVFLTLPKQFDAKFIQHKQQNAVLYNDSTSVTPAENEYPSAEQRSTSQHSNTSQQSTSDHILNAVFSTYQNSNRTEYTDDTVQAKREQIDRFGVAWNAIVDDLRNGDLISNQEKQLLIFRVNDTNVNEPTFNIPLFLTAGTIEQLIDYSAELTQQQQTHQKNMADLNEQLIEFCSQPLRKHALQEFWQQTTYLLTNLLGDRHSKQLQSVLHNYSNVATNGFVLNTLNLQQLSKVKKSLLDLIRSLRIAAASFTSVQLHEIENEEDNSDQTDESDDIDNSEEEDDDDTDEYNDEDTNESKQPDSDTTATPLTVNTGGTSKSSTTRRNSITISTSGSKMKKYDAQLSLSSMLRSPSVGTLTMLEKIRNRPRYSNASIVKDEKQRQYVILHVNLIREQANSLVTAMLQCTKSDKSIISNLQEITSDNAGFLWDDTYAARQIHALMKNSKTQSCLNTLHTLLTIAKIDAEPKNLEARRRLLFFGNSLFMETLPVAPSVRTMKSWTVLTPFYSEDITYSWSDLEKETEDGVSVLMYLQTIYPQEWQNFLQRIGLPDNISDTTQLIQYGKQYETRLWATARGQTLTRTCDGMMLYERALQCLAQLEDNNLSNRLTLQLAQQKFQYVISCQVYGKQKREMDPKAADIDALLLKYGSLRVAYIDHIKRNKNALTHNNRTNVVDEYYSVLIKATKNTVTNQTEVHEVYRVRLPGNPVLGEGKPENQNHAMIFTRGEYLQTIDMNQANYFEEALKVRNLLQEFDDPYGVSKPIGIVGCREQVYTGSLSSIAYYMAMQEGCFVSLGQRVLDTPLRVRLHYGHPDIFDKLWFMQRGGVSKAASGVHLSEDIFAGYNAVLRGASVVMREYVTVGKGRDVGLQQLFKFEAKLSQGAAMQCLTRDVYRFSNSVDFFRLLSYFYGGTGFYIANQLTIWALILFTYSRFFLSATHWEPYENFSGATTLSYWFGQMGFLYTLPILGNVGVERGFRAATIEVLRMICTGGPIYYIFHMGTKAYFFSQTILAGGAKYRPTGRGFVTRHESYAEIYRFHASSHFYPAFELLLLLALFYYTIIVGESYVLITWAAYLIVISWLFGPVWFNPMAFDFDKVVLDYMNYMEWMRRSEGDGDQSWKQWWKEENSFYQSLDWPKKINQMLYQLRHAAVGFTLIYWAHTTHLQLYTAAFILIGYNLLISTSRRPFNIRTQQIYRAGKAILALILVVGFVMTIYLSKLHLNEVGSTITAIISVGYITASLMGILLILGSKSTFILQWYQMYDYCIANFVMFVVGTMSLLTVPAFIQTRLMFHNAFSRGVLIDKLLKHRKNDDNIPVVQPTAVPATTAERESLNSKHTRNLSQQAAMPKSPAMRAASDLLSSISLVERSPSPHKNKRLLHDSDNISPLQSPQLGTKSKPNKKNTSAHFNEAALQQQFQQHGHNHSLSSESQQRRISDYGSIAEESEATTTPQQRIGTGSMQTSNLPHRLYSEPMNTQEYNSFTGQYVTQSQPTTPASDSPQLPSSEEKNGRNRK